MQGQQLQDLAREVAEELPASNMSHPFGPEHEVYKVRGKVFLLLTDVPGEPIVVIKADPEDSEALREEYPDITPGYHMNKRHWISLDRLVVAGLPRAQRPIDPETFGETRRT